MKRRMRPIADACDERVLDWIDVAILDVPRVVGLIPDEMLPKSTLPDPAFTTCTAYRAQPLLLGDCAREPDFDPSPAHRKIRVVPRQGPDRMKVVWQHHERVDVKREALARVCGGLAESIDLVSQEGAAAIEQIDGKEPAASRNKGAAIVRHVRSQT